MRKSKVNEIKELDKLAKKIAKKKQRLEEQMQADQETSKWYDQVLKESGFKRPRAFVKALMDHFGIREVSLTSKKRGPGRPAQKAAATTATRKKGGARRKRTEVTAELRDKVKAALKEKTAKNAIAKQFSISYPVVRKIEEGGYDKL